MRLTANPADAEDMVQETFLRAYRQLSSFKAQSSFPTWLHRICVNCTLDLLRSRHARQAADDQAISHLTSSHPSAHRLLEDQEFRTRLAPALAELSGQERTAFAMRHLDGSGIAEIARHLSVEENTAKQTVYRAVQKLRRALRPLWRSTAE